MKHELELKIQGYLDQELETVESREVAVLINRDPEAQRLHESLGATRRLLVEHEPEYKLPETREFYWSKIEREIRNQAAAPGPVRTYALGWQNWWIRLAGAVASVAVLGVIILSSSRLRTSVSTSNSQEVESPEDMSAITFHSEAANMTVVWVQLREDTN